MLNQHAQAMAEATMMRIGEPGEDLVRRSTDAFFSFVEHNPFAWRMLFRDPPADEQIAAAHARIHQQGTAAIAALIHMVPALRMSVDMPRERADEMLGAPSSPAMMASRPGGTSIPTSPGTRSSKSPPACAGRVSPG